jgi:hypothetical protein
MSHNTPPTVRHIVDLDAIKTPLGSQYWGVIKKYFNVIYAHIIYIKKIRDDLLLFIALQVYLIHLLLTSFFLTY